MDERADRLFGGGWLADLKEVTRLVFGDTLNELSGMIYRGELSPKHGPGKTQDQLDGNQKWKLPTWHERLERLFPAREMIIPNDHPRNWYLLDLTRFLTPEEEPPVKLTDVPKTRTTPRLIAIEPTCMQFVQQALSIPLREKLDSHWLASYFVGFEHQWPNQAMAQYGSEEGLLATLDLSEASDRVANWLVEEMFGHWPLFLEGIQACRSTTARLPSGVEIQLLKFASMGSALTFPIEAMVFTAVVLTGLLRVERRPPSRGAIMRFRDSVRVYGDDIIVPADKAESVIDALELFGFKVNRRKSFWTGRFRESCGREYWSGYDVSIVRFRKGLPTSLQDVDEIVSTVATRNLLAKAGMVKTAELLDDVLKKILRDFPYVAETSPILGRHHPLGYYQVDRLDDDTHSPRTWGWVVKPKIPKNGAYGETALLKCLLEVIGNANVDEDHLERSGRPKRVSIKLGWSPPY
jgi:hypothetical protein